MRPLTRNEVVGCLLAGLVLVLVAVPTERWAPSRVYPAAAFAGALLLVRRQLPKGSRPRLPRPVPPAEPARPTDALGELARLEGTIAFAARSERLYETVFVPQLRDLADDLLEVRHGVVREQHPDRAREILGEELWQLYDVRPRPHVGERPGPPPQTLIDLVDRVVAV